MGAGEDNDDDRACMGTETTPTANTPDTPERVYVEIPRAKPGQGYHAPKNYDMPLLRLGAKVLTIVLCLSLPGASGLIFGMILSYDPNARTKFLWIWIPLTIFIMLIAFLAAYGVAREGLGIARDGTQRARKAVKGAE